MSSSLTENQLSQALTVYENIAHEWSCRKDGVRDKRAFEAALVTLSALTTGIEAKPKNIAAFTRVDGRPVAAIGRRMTKAGLWDEGQATYGIGDDADLRINFLIAEGLIEVTSVGTTNHEMQEFP